jgi:predicted PilT family ATPase
VVINPINPIKSRGLQRDYERSKDFPSRRRGVSKKERIELNVIVEKERLLMRAAPEFASQNIEIYADDQQIFTGSLSRKSEITLSLLNKEGRKILKEIDRNKDIYGRIK